MIIELPFVRFWRALDEALIRLGHATASGGDARDAWTWGLDARGVMRRRAGVGEP